MPFYKVSRDVIGETSLLYCFLHLTRTVNSVAFLKNAATTTEKRVLEENKKICP